MLMLEKYSKNVIVNLNMVVDQKLFPPFPFPCLSSVGRMCYVPRHQEDSGAAGKLSLCEGELGEQEK